MIVAGMQLSRRQRRAGLPVEGQKLDDVADDLGKYEAVAARHDRHGTRSEPPQLLQAALIRQHIDRLELDPTDRQGFLNPEAARSMRLPKHLDRFVHPSPLGICRADRRAGFPALQLGAPRAYSPTEFPPERRKP